MLLPPSERHFVHGRHQARARLDEATWWIAAPYGCHQAHSLRSGQAFLELILAQPLDAELLQRLDDDGRRRLARLACRDVEPAAKILGQIDGGDALSMICPSH
ncbi:hypothetical protein ACFSYD_22340 [Paracoccus aerius]